MSTSDGGAPTIGTRHQKRMGPAPFASFEDLSDEVRARLESPEEKNTAGSVVRLPGIREDVTPSTPAYMNQPTSEFAYTGISLVGAATASSSPPGGGLQSALTKFNLQAPTTPRIDISRASSSSHQDSRDSTPDREIVEGRDPATAKLGVGFREDGALDLRSSTEELDFHEQDKKKGKSRPQSPCLHDDSYQNHHQRKDSQCSEIGLLSISGRTSRLSSIGSQGSAQSRLSNASHLSILSGQSEFSRSPSPHKMLLETSFCGTKSPQSVSNVTIENAGTKVDCEVLEKVLLSRKHDPTEVILAEGISVQKIEVEQLPKQPPDKPIRRIEKRIQCVKSDITIKVDKPPTADNNVTPRLTKKIVAESGVEYIYIPLKGPLPLDHDPPNTSMNSRKISSKSLASQHARQTKGKHSQVPPKIGISSTSSSSSITKAEPKYIRIKLKPDHLYDDKSGSGTKPYKLDLEEIRTEEPITQQTSDPGRSLTSTPSVSPKLSRHVLKESNVGSKTPSPCLSRKSSFASLFRSKEAVTSPESPTIPGCRRKNTITGILRDTTDSIRERSRSRSKSRERERTATMSNAPSSTESIDSKTKQKSVFSIFKSIKGDKKSDSEGRSPEVLPCLDSIAKVEFKFNDANGNLEKRAKHIYEKPLEGDSIRIPLHSPTHYDTDSPSLQETKTPSQHSQDTVIEVIVKPSEPIVIDTTTENIDTNVSNKNVTDCQNRQNSTSSENIVFSTKIGSDNEIFTTKIPKNKNISKPIKFPLEPFSNGHVPLDLSKTPIEPMEENVPGVVGIENTQSSRKIPEIYQVILKKLDIEPTIADIPVKQISNDKNLITSFVADEDRNSSESERDSEASFSRSKKDVDVNIGSEFLEPERTGFVLQDNQDSFDDDLPYVPTTLPQERSAAVPIIPIKQRSNFEIKTCPIDRPRSTTPINPSCLEEYCEEVIAGFNSEQIAKTIEKLRISLPRSDSSDKSIKSPRKVGNTWFEFAEKGLYPGRRLSSEGETPPPLPPKGLQKEWINFEEVPERRKLPKRIQTIPSRGHIDVPDNIIQDHVVYNYVNPDECKCECHEIKAKEKCPAETPKTIQDDEVPLLENDPADEDRSNSNSVDRIKLDVNIADRRSLRSDSSMDLSMSVDQQEALVSGDVSLQTPFTTDLGLSSNRSSIVSQDDPPTPDFDSPNAFPKTS